MRTSPVPPLALFAAAYVGATLAITQESLILAVCALGMTQVAAALLLWRRPALVRERMRAQAPPALAEAAEVGNERSEGWSLTSAIVEQGRDEVPLPLCEPAGIGPDAPEATSDPGALVFWAITDTRAGAAVEIFRSRSVAEAALADVAARQPAATAGLAVIRLDFAALAGMSADGGSAGRAGLARAGRSSGREGGTALASPPEWLYRRDA